MKKESANWATLLSLSKMFKVKKATMIHYAQMGLFKPDMVVGKMALYDENKAVETWGHIQSLRKTGNTLAQIREIFNKRYANKGR